MPLPGRQSVCTGYFFHACIVSFCGYSASAPVSQPSPTISPFPPQKRQHQRQHQHQHQKPASSSCKQRPLTGHPSGNRIQTIHRFPIPPNLTRQTRQGSFFFSQPTANGTKGQASSAFPVVLYTAYALAGSAPLILDILSPPVLLSRVLLVPKPAPIHPPTPSAST